MRLVAVGLSVCYCVHRMTRKLVGRVGRSFQDRKTGKNRLDFAHPRLNRRGPTDLIWDFCNNTLILVDVGLLNLA